MEATDEANGEDDADESAAGTKLSRKKAKKLKKRQREQAKEVRALLSFLPYPACFWPLSWGVEGSERQ